MWAARFLADMGPEAVRAVDALKTATRDPEPVVRAWAFAALSSVEQNPAMYRVQIEHLVKEARRWEDESELDIQAALDDLDRSLDDRWLSRLRGSAITNDVELIHSLAARVDVNRPDRDNQTPLGLAVGNNHPEAVRTLLAAGADPNRRDGSDGNTMLHTAATKRGGEVLIEMLLKAGADPAVTNSDGKTPLDVALEHSYKESARRLRAMDQRSK
jgi:ankyrin repeat protein